MVLNGCKDLAASHPGQFVMLRPDDWKADPLLGRPLSLLGASADQAEFLIQVAGRGTADMVRLRPGKGVSVLGPVGSHFPEPDHGTRHILVAGGVGLAPLLMWLEHFQPDPNDPNDPNNSNNPNDPAPTLLYGGRTESQLVFLERLEATGATLLTATEDGSLGQKGLVTDLLVSTLKEHTDRRSRVFACGPPAMMAQVAGLCRIAKVPLDVSLENRMACGRGICLGCALSTPDGETYLVCKHGPVMPADQVNWNGL
jgi:dihydroorotate dehydrogenase electron transfer subunit